MLNFILFSFCLAVFYAGFLTGAKYKTISEFFRSIKLYAANFLKS